MTSAHNGDFKYVPEVLKTSQVNYVSDFPMDWSWKFRVNSHPDKIGRFFLSKSLSSPSWSPWFWPKMATCTGMDLGPVYLQPYTVQLARGPWHGHDLLTSDIQIILLTVKSIGNYDIGNLPSTQAQCTNATPFATDIPNLIRTIQSTRYSRHAWMVQRRGEQRRVFPSVIIFALYFGYNFYWKVF